MVTATDSAMLKEAFKEAIREVVFENRELLHDVLMEAMEDVAMIHAIEEGKASEAVEKKVILDLLDSAQ